MKYTLGQIFRDNGDIVYSTAWGRRAQLLEGLFERKGARYVLCAGVTFEEARREVARRYNIKPEMGTQAARNALEERRERLEAQGLYSLAKICQLAGVSRQYLTRPRTKVVLDGLFQECLDGWEVVPGHTLETAIAELVRRREGRIKSAGGSRRRDQKSQDTDRPPATSAPKQEALLDGLFEKGNGGWRVAPGHTMVTAIAELVRRRDQKSQDTDRPPATSAPKQEAQPAPAPVQGVQVTSVRVIGRHVQPTPFVVTSPHDLVRELGEIAHKVYGGASAVSVVVDGVTYTWRMA